MNYSEAIRWWFGRIDYEKRSAQPGDLKLDRMRALLHELGNPHRKLRLVHVAGTKGKGSTSAMLAGILQAAGYRVGLFTSPHLNDVSERIKIQGEPISPGEIAHGITDIATAATKIQQMHPGQNFPTFCEIGTALGFFAFPLTQGRYCHY